MRDGQHEGHSGHRIDEIIQDFDLSSDSKPNLVLINAVSSHVRPSLTAHTDLLCQSTNDCQQNYQNMQGTIGRLENMLTKVWEKSSKATIILSTLLPSSNANGANDRVSAFNPQIRNRKYPVR